VLPQVRFELAALLETDVLSGELLALRLAEDPELLRGYHVQFEDVDDAGLVHVRAVSTGTGDATVLVARAASVQPVEGTPLLDLALRDGRLLRVADDEALETNLRFERLDLFRDLRSLGAPDKTRLEDLGEYTDAELDRLEDQLVYAFQRGVRPTAAQRRHVRGIEAERWSRVQGGLLPFLVTLVAVVLLTGDLRGGARLWTGVVVAATLALIVPAQLVMEAAAHRGRLHETWHALAPSAAAAALLVAGLALRRRGRRAAR
jgi:hypothetical protein